MERVLIVATVPAPEDHLRRLAADAEVHVVAPASNVSRLEWLTNDEGEARDQAEATAEETAQAARPGAAALDTEVGDVDPLLAAEDALRVFPADSIVVVVAPEDEESWLERASVADGFERFGLPVRYVVAPAQ